MDSITLKNYRCFREKQTARLAPLTLLVGENSTGKTSFLALIRALWDVAFQETVPDFREEPYDLGVFRDIAHFRGRRGGRAESFEAGFVYNKLGISGRDLKGVSFGARFEERRGAAFPVSRTIAGSGNWLEVTVEESGRHHLRFGTTSESGDHHVAASGPDRDDFRLFRVTGLLREITGGRLEDGPDLEIHGGLREIEDFARSFRLSAFSKRVRRRPFATAPVRSRPRRTYDPTQPSRDAEGEYVPTYLAREFHRDQASWKQLKGSLEQFGLDSGLFDEITVNPLGRIEGTPFQLEVRKFGKRTKGPQRNLIDVGYGVSQALPILTELLRSDAPAMFLLQQPEVHLHPTAQAALGSLFCSLAGPGRQLVVETHSDYILDRVRMDIRDKKSRLKPDDVSILFFEPGDLDVNIHSIRLDAMGNVLDAPPGYGQFFMEEVRRSVGMSIRT